MIRVCDAIMGSGKSSAAISYINAHPEKRFLYLTPYLDEAARIKEGCPEARFAEPRNYTPGVGYGKSSHIMELARSGRNIASTHQAMFYYSSETIDLLRDNGYCVIIDEAINILERDTLLLSDDIQVALDAGLIYQSSPNEYRRTDKTYHGNAYSHMMRMISSRPLVSLNPNDKAMWCWMFSPELFKKIDDVFILTYMFQGSEMEQFLKINGLSFKYIGVSRSECDVYRFSENPDYVPEYVRRLGDLIHIENSEKLNAIGDGKYDLSMRWYENEANSDKVEQLRKNIYNYFRNIIKWVPASGRMCGTYEKQWGRIRSGGYGSYENNRVVFSQRSMNKWSGYTALVYPVNIFFSPVMDRYYAGIGGDIDKDAYALSIMLQWIWRSAIRNGEEIYIYIPSKRMRTLLSEWIKKTSEGGETIER